MGTPSPTETAPQKYVWYKELTRYQWFALAVAAMGWMFDCMAQQLFSIARKPAVRDLMGGRVSDGIVSEQAGYSTMILMIGWALGGVVFGILGDRLGRAKTMTLTILLYSLFTGMSFFAGTLVEFNIYRFLCALGVGGQFAVGVTLVAEVMPERARPYALGLVQALSTVGNMAAGLVGITLGEMERTGAVTGAWRWMFLIGALPAPMALLVFKKLKEPEAWLKARAQKKRMGSFGDLLGDPRWRRNSIVGMLLAVAGVIGLWGIGFFSYDLLRPVLERAFSARGLTGADLAGKVTMWIGITSLLQNAGCFLGIHAFTRLTQRTGRKKAFAIGFVAAMLTTSFTFWQLKEISQIFWMIPLMGFTQLALFGGYAIYLPELFPTRLRSTGTSFCYNVGRFLAAAGPLGLGLLTSRVYHGPDAMRYAGITMSLVFLLGLAALPFAPETKGQPLPE
ncbi:MAG: MFS transporter [Acidobacteriia bacterium]|nr:MFS transporter [Terriglobia bacterium]